MESDWYAGAAEADVTPPVGREMAGYASRRWATGMRDAIYVRGLVLRRDDTRIVILSADVLAVTAETVRRVREGVSRRYSVPGDHVMISASHNHTGPASVSIFQTEIDDAWLDTFTEACVDVVGRCIENLEFASLAIGRGDEKSFSFNRRLLGKNDQVVNALEAIEGLDPTAYRPEGPVDTSVGVLRVDVDGQCRAVLVNFGNHPDIPTGTDWSSDYPGQMAWAIRQLLGDQVIPLFLNGACGDVEHLNAFDVADMTTRDRYRDHAGEQKLVRYGTSLGAEVVRAALAARPMASDALAARNLAVAIPFRSVDEATLGWARSVLDDDSSDERDYAFAVEAFRVAALAGRTASVELQVMAIGELAIATNPNEMFAALGLRIKSESPFEHTFVAELTNGWSGYLPTPAAFEHGGYEVRPTRASHLAPHAADVIVDASIELLRDLYDRNQSKSEGLEHVQ